MRSSICINREQSASFSIAGLMLAIAPLWLMLAAANTSAHAQTPMDVSNSSSPPSPADWTEYHRDNMQRWNPYETVLGVNNVGSLQLKWKSSIGQFFQTEESSSAVVGGVIYFGSDDGNVYALNAGTGAKLWSYTTAGIVTSSPAVVNGVVYFGSSDSNVYALNAGTGTKLWSFATGSNVYSSPAVTNGVVYIGSDNGNMYALSASTGAKIWSFATGDIVFSSPAVANRAVYFGSEDGNIYALNASTGAKLWSFNTGVAVQASPAVANGVVYVSSNSPTMYALNASTGAKMWSFNTTGPVFSSPAVANGIVYFGSEDGNLYALNASTGAKLWSSVTGPNGFECSPAVANGVVYINGGDGNMYALNASTGVKLWNYPTGHGDFSSPTVSGSVVYIRAANLVSYLYAFALGSADLFLRIQSTPTTVHQGDLLTYVFPVWNLGPDIAEHEVLTTQVPKGTTFDYIRISGTPGLGTCMHPPYGGTGQIVCHEGDGMAPNTTWTVRLTVKVTAPAGTVITENAATIADTPDPNLANNTATASIKVQ
jgi:outer membrane protein assembly factor BamB